jgi:septal ring factor EnvC (AmiA/AmiB activator)
MSTEKNIITASISAIGVSCALVYYVVGIYPNLMTGSATSRAEFYSHAFAIVFAILFVIYICMRVANMEKIHKQTTKALDSKIADLSSEVRGIKAHMDHMTKESKNTNKAIIAALEKIEKSNEKSNERTEAMVAHTNNRIDSILVELNKSSHN